MVCNDRREYAELWTFDVCGEGRNGRLMIGMGKWKQEVGKDGV